MKPPPSNSLPKVNEPNVCSPAPSVGFVVDKSISTPSNVLRVIIFTTPATASAPYTAEAPPVEISIRSIKEVAMLFKSTALSPAIPPMKRRPLTRTSVLELPNPRRSVVFKPLA